MVKYFPEFPVWLGSASTVAQEAVEPLVVRYFPEWVAWLGTTYTLDVSRLIVTLPESPPPVNPVPAVTPVISPVVVNTCHAELVAFQTYILPSVVFQ